jgi:hypothetical protein
LQLEIVISFKYEKLIFSTSSIWQRLLFLFKI